MNMLSPLTDLKGIGEKTAQRFYAAGIFTVGDLIGYYPRGYDTFEDPTDVENAADGQILAVCGFIGAPLSVKYGGKFKIITGKIQTDSELVNVTWFNMPYLRSQIQTGRRYVFRGMVKQKGKRKVLTQPKIFDPEEYEEKQKAMQPVYPLVSGLTANMLRKAIRQALEGLDLSVDFLPEKIRRDYELAAWSYAIWQIHFPDDLPSCVTARKRLVFDEFLLFILGLRQLRASRDLVEHDYKMTDSAMTKKVLESLPYRLTAAQKKTWDQIRSDLKRRQVMARLVQGDVGSGKTIVAFLALIMTVDNGGQGALMVPTEVLARQHFEAFGELCKNAGLNVSAVLLTGSMTAKEKRAAYEQISSGAASVIIGTHALIQEAVTYHRLMLVITDEQHRFGVRQREALSFKGEQPHILVMSATPIPRTLAVILYGDLDVSVIDQMPEGRLPIKNAVVDTAWRPKAYAFLEKQVAMGHQAYVICPMVEENEEIEAENVIDYTDALRESISPQICVEYLHGKMRPKEKNEIMERFVRGEIQILVSTTVIEVGVNVPNATVMMVEDAQRFGLAQLHQLRGRVGRGKEQSYCILIDTSGRQEPDARLQIMNKSNDGFEIARKDLELRGPGDLFGIRQSGLIDFKLADVFSDASVMHYASEAAGRILDEDSERIRPEYAKLWEKVLSQMGDDSQNMNI